MALDMAEIEILLQRRYNSLREIERLTREMLDTVSRGDEISLSLMLDMRADEIEKYMVCQEQIWKKAEEGPLESDTVRRIMDTDPDEGLETGIKADQTAYQIRKKTVKLLREVQQLDQQLSLRIHAGQPR
jgi:hypothetical protein